MIAASWLRGNRPHFMAETATHGGWCMWIMALMSGREACIAEWRTKPALVSCDAHNKYERSYYKKVCYKISLLSLKYSGNMRHDAPKVSGKWWQNRDEWVTHLLKEKLVDPGSTTVPCISTLSRVDAVISWYWSPNGFNKKCSWSWLNLTCFIQHHVYTS